MTPQTTVDGIDVYNLFQIQEQTADDTHKFVSKGTESGNGGSLQPLVVQIHMDGNAIQFVFKGDSQRDQDVDQILNHDGSDTDLTSFTRTLLPT